MENSDFDKFYEMLMDDNKKDFIYSIDDIRSVTKGREAKKDETVAAIASDVKAENNRHQKSTQPTVDASNSASGSTDTAAAATTKKDDLEQNNLIVGKTPKLELVHMDDSATREDEPNKEAEQNDDLEK